MRRAFSVLALSLTFAATITRADDATLNGEAEVTGRAERGTRFELGGGRCGVFGYSEWRDDAGSAVAREELIYEGAAWRRYRLQRMTIAQDVEATREGGFIRLNIRDGERFRKVRIEVEGEVLAGPTLITHLQSQLRELRRGRPVELQYLVAEQAMVLGLSATTTGYGAGGLINVRLEASSALLRPFVPTTVITFDGEGRFVGMQGRLLPQRQRGVALDGVIRVTYVGGMRVASMKSGCNKSTSYSADDAEIVGIPSWQVQRDPENRAFTWSEFMRSSLGRRTDRARIDWLF